MANSTETNWSTYQYVQYIFYFIQIAFYGLCLMGNFLTMIAVVKFENLYKKPTNILIFSLAIADGFQGFNLVTKILAIFYHGTDTFSKVVCFAYLWFNRASSAGNVITICLISVERFLCIFFPLKSMIWITTARMKKVVLTSWVFISVKMTMEMIFGGQYNPVFPCLWALYFHRHMVLAMIVQFAAYSVITLTLNIAIFVKVKCRTLKRNQLGSSVSSKSGKTTRMMAIIIGTYYALYLPSIVNYLVDYDRNVERYVFHIITLLYYFNAVLNPIIYAWMNRDFRDAFRKILRLKNKSESYASNTFNTGTTISFSTQSAPQSNQYT